MIRFYKLSKPSVATEKFIVRFLSFLNLDASFDALLFTSRQPDSYIHKYIYAHAYTYIRYLRTHDIII